MPGAGPTVPPDQAVTLPAQWLPMAAQQAGETRSVLIVGTGMIGTSVAMALAERGHRILLDDSDAANLGAAAHISGGTAYGGEAVDVAVVAVPPRHTGAI